MQRRLKLMVQYRPRKKLGVTICDMGQAKKDRTEFMKQRLVARKVGSTAMGDIEQYNFNRLIAKGIVIAGQGKRAFGQTAEPSGIDLFERNEPTAQTEIQRR